MCWGLLLAETVGQPQDPVPEGLGFKLTLLTIMNTNINTMFLLHIRVNDTLMLLTEGGACTSKAEKEDTYTLFDTVSALRG